MNINKSIIDFLYTSKLITGIYGESKTYHHHFKLSGDINFQLSPVYMNNCSLMNGLRKIIFKCSYYFRFEYNPNNTSLANIKEFFNLLFIRFNIGIERLKVTRMDFAIDYVQFIPLYSIACKGIQKYKYIPNKVTGEISTVYFGASKSKSQFRIYDKKTELTENQGVDCIYKYLTRVELTYTKRFFWNTEEINNVFRNLSFYRFDHITDNPSVNKFIRGAKRVGLCKVLKVFTGSNRYRMIKKLEEFHIEDEEFEHPSKIFDKYFPIVYSDWKQSILKLIKV